jgi:predicted GTPase
VYAGVDYSAIFDAAQREADVIVWDGGNNDTPFARPDLWVCVADPLRPTAQTDYYPGDANFLRADLIVVNKANTAPKEGVDAVLAAAAKLNPKARAYATSSVVRLPDGNGALALAPGARVVVVEDGPTMTHGGMPTGAGYVAALQAGAVVVDPRPFFVGEMADTLAAYPHIGPVVPAMGYSPEQLRSLAATLQATPADAAILVASPTDLECALPPGSLAGRRVLQATYGLDAREANGGAALASDFAAFFKTVAANTARHEEV